MFKKQAEALATVWRNPDFKRFASGGVLNLIKFVVFDDIESGIATAADLEKIIIHTPTIIYWDKMYRYMQGVFIDGNTRTKMAEKFNDDNPKYISFVKKQMQLINDFNDDGKIYYFAQLTRCYLNTQLDVALYLKLANFLSLCTLAELEFLEKCSVDCSLENSMMASSLSQFGLLKIEVSESGKSVFVLTDFAKALKQNSLNYDDGLGHQIRLISYDMMVPDSLPEFASSKDIEMLFHNQELILDAGGANEWGTF